MTLVRNDWGYKCSWCGAEVDRVTDPADGSGPVTGVCDEDGIVYVFKSYPPEANA